MSAKSLSSADVISLFDEYVVPNYRRYPVCLVRGEGSLVWDAEGKEYLDFFPGWGCNLLGHCPPRVVQAVQEQIAELIHVPNTWYIEAQGRWAEALSQRSFGGQAFFCNSGAEANEAAIKLARLHGSESGRYQIVTFLKSFHGRTFGAVTASGQTKMHAGLGPLVAGFRYAPFGDLAATEELLGDETIAIMIEPVQGEGGVNIPDREFLAGLRRLCDERGMLLIFDEVQTGCGRTGEWFAYQHFNVTPDVMTLAKSLCGGVAGGALLARREVAPSLKPGMHAATFGGNPIAARAGLATIEAIEEEGLLERAAALGELFRGRLKQAQAELSVIREVRVLGLMIGVELTQDGTSVVQACMERGLLVNCTQGNVVRLLPAMTLTDDQANHGLDVLIEVLGELSPSVDDASN